MHLPIRRFVVCFLITIATLAFDQTSKAWAHTLPVSPPGCTTADLIAHRCGGVPQPVIDGLWDWDLTYNTGAAFSNFEGARVLLSVVASLALVAFGVMMIRSTPEQRVRRVGLALIAGGTAGNLFDRMRDGAVTDFVQLHVKGHYWPIFNVADIALGVGVGLLLLESVRKRRERAPAHRPVATI